NLIPGDVGRPITDINPNINLGDIGRAVSQVMESMTVRDQDLQAKDGQWYSMRIRPYRTLDNKIEGVTVSFFEMELLKRGRESEAVVETIREPLLVLGANYKVLTANGAFCRVFETTKEETVNKTLYQLGNGQWNIPALRTLLEEILQSRTTV